MRRRSLLALVALGTTAATCSRPAAPAPGQRRRKVIVIGLDAAAIGELRAAAPTIELIAVADSIEASAHIDDAEALLGGPSSALLRRGRALRWVHIFAAGVERFVVPALLDAGIVLTNERAIHGPAVADHAMALLLGISRRLGPALAHQRAHVWDRSAALPLLELTGKTAVIVGFGGIGRAIATRAAAFGMTIVAVDREAAAPPPGVEAIVDQGALARALARADVLFLAVPLTAETAGMIDGEALAHLPAGAILINVARGGVVDTAALVDALAAGRLGGAGLDVSDPEPLPADHPLWARGDVILTAHVAGLSDRTRARRLELAGDNLRRFAADEPLRSVVDVELGF